MNQDLVERWKTNRRPFDDAVLHPDDLLPIGDLRTALRAVVDELKRSDGDAELVAVEDWHEHDGYVTSGTRAQWSDIVQMLETDESLYASRQGDTHVRRAFYSADGRFLLRWYVLEKDEDDQYPGIWGEFDVSASTTTIQPILEELSLQTRPKMKIDNAKEYFARNEG